MKKVAIVLNSPELKRNIEEDVVIAADAGYLFAQKQGKEIEVVIGDFDSSKKPKEHTCIELNPIKDDTDGQACLEYAYKKGYNEIAFYGLSGGRLDHILCNISLLIKASKLNLKAIAKEKDYNLYYLEKGHYEFAIKEGNEFSTILFSDKAVLSSGKNMKYPINNLLFEKDNLGRGISNVALSNKISFDILEGSILLFIFV